MFESEHSDSTEVEGVEVGGYDDFHAFRQAIATNLEGGRWGCRFPVLMDHHDSDGEWAPDEANAMAGELLVIGDELARIAPVQLTGWAREVAVQLDHQAVSLLDSYIDVDGERLVERLLDLVNASVRVQQPISFQ